jgi:hypothetical protein
MNTDRARRLAFAALPLLLAGCEHDYAGAVKPASSFGEANRQTMMAQVIDPDPQYETLTPPTSGEHAGQAVDRYRKDKVKKPERVMSTQTGRSGSGSGGGS